MKKVKFIFVIVILAFLSLSCEGEFKSIKHTKSSMVGLNRIVTLYNCNGDIIKVWVGQFMVETTDGVASFITDDGKEVKINGIYTIEEQ